MGYFDGTSTESKTDVETAGKYLSKFTGARAEINTKTKPPKASVLLDFRVEKSGSGGAQPYGGATKTDWLTITGATSDNKYWMFQRFLHAFGLTEDQIKSAVANARHDGEVAAALVKLVEPFKGRKVWMNVFQNKAGYINIGGEIGRASCRERVFVGV